MLTTDFGNSLESCRSNIKEPDRSSFGEDIGLIMQSMGIQACKSSSTSACVSAQAGWGATSAKSCIGTEKSAGCEQLMANFSKTRIVKEALTCAIKNRIQEATTRVDQVNSVRIELEGAKCCTCGNSPTGCAQMDADGNVSGYKCLAIGDINQTNTADIKTLTSFSIDESEDVKNTILTAVSEDVSLAADTAKEGLGADTGQKVINASEIESITKNEDLSLTNNIQKTLNELSQTNEAVYNLNGMESVGPCIGNITQENVIKLVVENIMAQTLKSVKENMDSSTYTKVIDAVASKKVVGLDVGADPAMGGVASIMTIIGLVVVVGGLYTLVKGGGGGVSGTAVEVATGGDPKAQVLLGIAVVSLGILFLLWFFLMIKSFLKSLTSGFGLF